jgi:hypothetical protein
MRPFPYVMRAIDFHSAGAATGGEGGAAFSRPSRTMDWAFALTIAALFSGLNQHIGPAKVQMADLLMIATIATVVMRDFATPRVSRPLACLLAVYLLIYVISAFSADLGTGIKEILQIGLSLAFLTAAFGYYRTRSTDRFVVLVSLLIGVILVYNIAWHLFQGRYVGWKSLNEPKTAFILLPMILILNVDRFGRGGRSAPLFVLLAALAGLVILLSGERKAYLFAVAALVIWNGPRGLWRYVLVAAVLAPLVAMVVSADRTSYLGRQVASLSEAFTEKADTLETASVSTLLDDRRPSTLSNVQRELSERVARSMWEKEPVWGIGTGAFAAAIKRETSLPEVFRMNIHGEFQRALYENGVVGLVAYASLWLTAFAAIAWRWSATTARGDPSLNRIKLACVVMFLIYCGFEASKGLTLLCICVLPFLVALPPRNAQGRK